MDDISLDFLESEGYTLLLEFEENVALFEKNGSKHAIKRGKRRATHLQYEYDVGKRVHSLALVQDAAFHRIPAKTVDLLVEKDRKGTIYQYLVTEYVPGISVYKFMKSDIVGEEEKIRRFIRMMKMLMEFDEKIGFTHYDLHLHNIITNDNLETFTLIDFGSSHVKGVSGWTYASPAAISIGVAPSVHDPFHDAVRLLVFMHTILKMPMDSAINNLITSCNFSTYIGLDGEQMPEYIIHDYQEYVGAEIINVLLAVDVVPEDTIDTYGWWIDDGSNPQQNEDIMKCPNYFIRKNGRHMDIDTLKAIGCAISTLKRRAMEKRPHSLQSLLGLIDHHYK